MGRQHRLARVRAEAATKKATVERVASEVVEAREALYAGGAAETYYQRVRTSLESVGAGYIWLSVLHCLGDRSKIEVLLFDALKDRRMT